jgi:hypothetical protein
MMISVALRSAYLVAYLVMLRPGFYVLMAYPSILRENPFIKLPAQYRFGGRATEMLFAPANLLERLIRPSRWESKRILSMNEGTGATRRAEAMIH